MVINAYTAIWLLLSFMWKMDNRLYSVNVEIVGFKDNTCLQNSVIFMQFFSILKLNYLKQVCSFNCDIVITKRYF